MVDIKKSEAIDYTPLADRQIRDYEVKYQRKLERLCVKYALEFQDTIIKEYGYNILGLKRIPLSSHFNCRLDKFIRQVTVIKRDRAISVEILERIKQHIISNFNNLKDSIKQERKIFFNKVINLIDIYKIFSDYVSSKSGQGKFSISNIKFEDSSDTMAAKSWLIENLRYIFPKRFGFPLRDDIMSWFIYGDTPEYGLVSKLKWTTEGKELYKRLHLAELLTIDYRISKLTIDDFADRGIAITKTDLEKLQLSTAYLIYFYIFGGHHDVTYVSSTTSKNIEVGPEFFKLEYEVIRAVFFARVEANDGIPVNFETIVSEAGIVDLKNYLYQGFGFGDNLETLRNYIEGLSQFSLSNPVFRSALETLEGYSDDYRIRRRVLRDSREYPSAFQGNVHKFTEDFLGVKFLSEERVRSVVKDKYITTINDDGIEEKIYIHGSFSYDCYLELSNALKDYLGLDRKWTGIAIEAMGTYWHGNNFPSQQEADRKKQLISREKNVILIEIKEEWDENLWGAKILEQIEKMTGVKIPQQKLSELSKYLGSK